MAALTSPTADELIVNVRAMLGQPDENNSNWSNEQVLNYLNEAVRRYFGEVVQKSEGLFTKQADLDIVSGTDTIALPSDWFEIVRLYKKIGTEYYIMPYDNAFNQDYTTNGPSSSTNIMSYYFRGDDLVLRDVPQFSETGGLRMEYIFFPETMVHGGDTLTTNVAPVFKDLIEMYAVYKCKLAESIRGSNVDVISAIKQDVADLYRQFRDVIEERAHYTDRIQAWSPEDL